MSTPEAKVKKLVKKVLAEFTEEVMLDGFLVPTLYQYWPVPSGFGASSLDCIACYYGRAIYIETKAPGKHPTPRQNLTIAEVSAAKGIVLVIDGEVGLDALRQTLILIRLQDAHDCLTKA